jgi:hypothetical protein
MRIASFVAALALFAAPAFADFYIAGDFNGWNAAGQLMNEVVPGQWQTTVTNAPGRHEFKVTIGEWSQAWPGNNARTDFGDDGELTINFYPTPAADGWNPPANRVGYSGDAIAGWEVIGSFNGWSSPVVQLDPLGGGAFSGQYVVPTAGTYFFKFREFNNWDVSIGSDFSNSGYDIQLDVAADATPILFELDLPGGRWRTSVIPEPAALLMLLAGLTLRRR